MKLLVLTLVCLIPMSFSLTLTDKSFKPCEVSPGRIQSVSVEPCSAEPCTVSAGASLDIATTFISTHNTGDDCYLRSSFLFAGAWFEMSNELACGTDVTCPLVTGSTYTLKKNLIVDDILPKGQQLTRWKLVCNAAADEIFCGEITINMT